MKRKKIDEEQFVDALYHALEQYFYTDPTDYFNFVGMRDFCRFAWKCLDKRSKWQKKKWSTKSAEQLKKEFTAEIQSKYKKVFGNIYIKS